MRQPVADGVSRYPFLKNFYLTWSLVNFGNKLTAVYFHFCFNWHWFATLQAISDPCCQTPCLWLCPCVCVCLSVRSKASV